jgi:hypothetical protein
MALNIYISTFLFLSLQWFACINAQDDKTNTECYGEMAKYINYDIELPQKVDGTFPVKVFLSQEAKTVLPKGTAISAELRAHRGNFYIYDSPPSSFQLITDQDSQWEWGVQALKAGTNYLSLRVGVLKIGPQNTLIREENCRIQIAVTVKELPLYKRAGKFISENWGLLLTNLITVILAIAGWCRKPKNGTKT